MIENNKHIHNWRIFRDPSLNNTGYLSFFCGGCLKLKKVLKKYED
jgi:hypothetical protein